MSKFKVSKKRVSFFFHGIILVKLHQSFHRVCFYSGETVLVWGVWRDFSSVVFYLLKLCKQNFQGPLTHPGPLLSICKEMKLWLYLDKPRALCEPNSTFPLPIEFHRANKYFGCIHVCTKGKKERGGHEFRKMWKNIILWGGKKYTCVFK